MCTCVFVCLRARRLPMLSLSFSLSLSLSPLKSEFDDCSSPLCPHPCILDSLYHIHADTMIQTNTHIGQQNVHQRSAWRVSAGMIGVFVAITATHSVNAVPQSSDLRTSDGAAFDVNLFWDAVVCHPGPGPNKTTIIPCLTTAKAQHSSISVTPDGVVDASTSTDSTDPVILWHSTTTVHADGTSSEIGNITFGTTAGASAQHTFFYTTFGGQTKPANDTVTLAALAGTVTGGVGMFKNAVGFHVWTCHGNHLLSAGTCWSSTSINTP